MARDGQYGFTKGRGGQDARATLKMLLQTRREHGQDTYEIFLDLVKAFDTVNRELLLIILGLYGIPQELIDIIAKLYTDVFVKLDIDGVKEIIESFTGVKQGDNLAPILFLYVMQAVLDTLDKH